MKQQSQQQPAQFKRTNIKVIKASQASQQQHQSHHNNQLFNAASANANANNAASQQMASQQPRVINISMFQVAEQKDSSSLGPPKDRTPVNSNNAASGITNSLKSMSQEPQTVRTVSNNMRQLAFGSVKKVINTTANPENTFAPDQITGIGVQPSTTTTTAKTKLYLPSKKNSGQSPGAAPTTTTAGVQLQDGHRRRLQALAASQHHHNGNVQQSSEEGRRDLDDVHATQNTSNTNNNNTMISVGLTSVASNSQKLQQASSVSQQQQQVITANTNSSGVSHSNSNSQNNRMKVINKKLITLSTKKVNGRNVAAANSAETVVAAPMDNSKSVSATRPAALNLNFNATTNLTTQQSGAGHQGGIATVTNYHHSSAMSRFSGITSTVVNVKKQNASSDVKTHRQNSQMHKTRSGDSSVQEKASSSLNNSAGRAPPRASSIKQQSKQKQPLLGGSSIKIRQEVSPNRTAFNIQSQGAAQRKPTFNKVHHHHQGGGLGYRRHQIIQDITDDTSPSGKTNNFNNAVGGAQNLQRKMAKQSSDSSMQSINQITQALNKQSDLKKVFYAKIAQSPSNKSINTLQSNQSSGGPPSSQPSQQFTLTKKASLISQENSASTSRERTLNFKLKKHGQHGQLQNHKEKHSSGTGVNIQLQQQLSNAPPPQSSNIMPSLGKRRPLVIRKNNFVLTKGGGESSNGSGDRGDSGGAGGSSSMNTAVSGIQRILIQPLDTGQVQQNPNKLNMTLHSNNSGNRALNNTQKIGRAGQGGHGLNSNDSLGSDASLSQTRNQLGKTLAAVNASIKKAQLLQKTTTGVTTVVDQAFYNSAPGGSSSQRKTSEQSLEKLIQVNTGSSPTQPNAGSRLIKVNRSKKKLDTARRSRIQQLKDITLLDQASFNGSSGTNNHRQQFSSTIHHQQSRGIPQLNKNHSNEIVKTKLVTPGKILQVQTDFNATLPIHIHKPAGSVTIKADYSRKAAAAKVSAAPASQQQRAPGSVERSGDHEAAASLEAKDVSNFNTNPSRGARNQKNNGLRPVRLFNYATQTTSAPNESIQAANNNIVVENNTATSIESNKKCNDLIQRSLQRDKEDRSNVGTGVSNLKVGQPTPSSTKSQKSLRRGQIFRKQTRRNSQVNDEQQSFASKENSNGLMPHDVLTHMTTPTDAQNVSSTNLPLKTRRSNHLASQRQLADSDKNQQSSYFQSSSGDKVGFGGTSKPDSQTNKSGTVTVEGGCVSGINNGKLSFSRKQQILKQFDSEGKLVVANHQHHHTQQKSANDLKMKNDHSEMIVPETQLNQQQQNSAEQIIPLVSRHQGAQTDRNPAGALKTSDKQISIVDGITKGAKEIEISLKSVTNDKVQNEEQENLQQNTRRSLERVESIKNLHSFEGSESAYKDDKDWLPSSRGAEKSQKPSAAKDQKGKSGKKRGGKDRYPPVVVNNHQQKSQKKQNNAQYQQPISKPAIIDKKMLILAPQADSGTSSGELVTAAAAAPQLENKNNRKKDDGDKKKKQSYVGKKEERRTVGIVAIDPASFSSHTRDNLEPNKPHIPAQQQKPPQGVQENKQQEELRIQHNETLPPPGPMSASSNQTNGQVKKNIAGAVVNKFSVTKGSDLAREILTQTADTSNRKTISNQRAYCNSSDSRTKVIGTAFSFKSQTTTEQQQEVPQFPMTPQQALVYFQNQLTDYEKKEILDYPEIYFIGAPTAQKVQGSSQLEHNYGYDDDKGDYKVINNDHIGFRYEIKTFLGKGSFGTALKCFDHKTRVDIAVKVVKNKKKYYYQAGVELKILQFLKQNDPEDIMNVIHLNDFVIFRKHLCIGFELMSMNLFEFLKINDFNGFDHNLIRRFAIQLLYALKYLKMFQIIHCDLKPENILLKESNKSGIKIIDFGSSTFMDERVYTYIQSRFYRAPEIMLGIPYDCAIDMWSFGCIMAELYIGYPIFPGDSENDQMSRLMEMVDVPDPTVLSMSSRKDKFFTKSPDGTLLEPIMCKNSRGKLRKPMGKPLGLVIGDEDPDFTDFVERCLVWNPHVRLTPDEALKHVWILKGLPPQVLIHHQKMHNIGTPELPQQVLEQRNEFLEEQRLAQRAQEIQELQKQQKQQQCQKIQTSTAVTGCHIKQQHQQQQQLSQSSPSKSQTNAATAAAVSNNATHNNDRTSGGGGKIRLKRSTLTGQQQGVTRNQVQQAYHTTGGVGGGTAGTCSGRPPVLPPGQVTVSQHAPQQPNIIQNGGYPLPPGSTSKSSSNQHKSKSLGHASAKMTLKVQQHQQQVSAALPQQTLQQHYRGAMIPMKMGVGSVGVPNGSQHHQH